MQSYGRGCCCAPACRLPGDLPAALPVLAAHPGHTAQLLAARSPLSPKASLEY